jgi:hypothetical protein
MKLLSFGVHVRKQAGGFALFLLILVLPVHAQTGPSLGQVRTIAPWVQGRSDEIARLTDQLARSLGKANVFSVVNPEEEHDAWLVIRTCDRHGNYLPPSSDQGQVCAVFLSDAHDIYQPPIWYMSRGWVKTIFILAASKQDAVPVLTECIKAPVLEQRNSIRTDSQGPRQARGPRRARFWLTGVEARFWLAGAEPRPDATPNPVVSNATPVPSPAASRPPGS